MDLVPDYSKLGKPIKLYKFHEYYCILHGNWKTRVVDDNPLAKIIEFSLEDGDYSRSLFKINDHILDFNKFVDSLKKTIENLKTQGQKVSQYNRTSFPVTRQFCESGSENKRTVYLKRELLQYNANQNYSLRLLFRAKKQNGSISKRYSSFIDRESKVSIELKFSLSHGYLVFGEESDGLLTYFDLSDFTVLHFGPYTN